MKILVVVLSVVAVVTCGPLVAEESVLHTFVENFVSCVNSDLGLCLKEHALQATEKLGTARKLNIVDGVTLLNNNPKEPRSLEPLSDEPALRTKQVSERLWNSASDLLQSSELELSYGGAEEEQSRSIDENVEEGRGKKKKQIRRKLKVLIPLLLLGKAKAVALIVLAILVIAASLFKLALIAKLAFILKVIGIIKALLAKKNAQEETWEPHGWEPHPEHVHVEHGHADHGHGWDNGWSRSRNEANNLAYSAYSN